MLSSIILLSSGLDSCLALVEAMKSTRVASAITFDYGQVARKAEIAHAKKIAKHFGIPHKIVSLPIFKNLEQHPLINSKKGCPRLTPTQLTNTDFTKKTAKAVWIPNRNGVFLNITAALAEAENIQRIYVGFNKEEAATFPDNSMAFVNNVNKCLESSTLNSVRVFAPTIGMNKTQILKKLMAAFPLNLIWSCYRGGAKMCGHCESCVRLKRAIQSATCDRSLFNF